MAAPASVRDVIGRRRATMLEALSGEGLVLVRDNAESEGRSLLKALVSEAVAREEPVLVVLLEVPWEQFQEGLSPDVRERLQFRDLFGDPLCWGSGEPPALWGSGPRPPTLALDSLSWALLREPLPRLCRHLLPGPGGAAPRRVLALLHQELHPRPQLVALGALARAQLVLGGPPETPGDPRSVCLIQGHRQETLTLLPDGSLGPPAPSPRRGGPEIPENPQIPGIPGAWGLPFRLGLSRRERGERAALRAPYLPSAGSDPEAPPEDPEDPDDDLEL